MLEDDWFPLDLTAGGPWESLECPVTAPALLYLYFPLFLRQTAFKQFFYIPYSISIQRGHVLNYGGKKSDIDNTKQKQTVLLFLIS